MKVLYDGTIYGFQEAGGVNQYIARLIDLAPEDLKPVLATNIRRSVNYPINPRLETLYFKRFCFRPGRLSFLAERAYFRHKMLGAGFDVFHPSLYGENLARAPLGSFRCPLVVTVHDMIDEIYPEVDPTGIRRAQKVECIGHASALICVSENTRMDLLERHPEVEAKTHVIPNGCEIDTSTIESREGVPTDPYFLFVGGRRSAYKNFVAALHAMKELAKTQGDVKLAVAGAALTSDELREIEELGLAGKIISFDCPDEPLLACLYRWSIALVYPSAYEGFGIPPLEAMACGTVAIAANRSSIPEVVGDAGILFDPADPGALPSAMKGMLDDPSQREKLILLGRERVKGFSWARTAEQTFDVYRSIC